MTKRYHHLTRRTLDHILSWGKHQSKLTGWNKTDSNIYNLVQAEVKRLEHEAYLKRKAIKVNPYLDPKQPFHTT